MANDQGIDPDRVSFTRALRAARRSARAGFGTSTKAVATALCVSVAEVGHELLPERRLRAAARVVKRKMSNYGVKRPEHASWPRPTRPALEAVKIVEAARA